MTERHTRVRGFQIVEGSVKETDLDIFNTPSVDKILGYTSNGMEWIDNPKLSIIYGASLTYLRIGDANTTSHSLASEDDLMITGKLEVDGLIYLDNHLQIHTQNELRLFDDDNSHYVGFKSPALTGTQIWTLPDSDGTNGQVLKTNGSGVLDWATVGGGEYITKDINQVSHGLSVGDVIYYNGTSYAKAKADAEATAEVVGIVSAVAGVDDFTICMGGYVSGLSGLTAGTVYYLSDDTAGTLTTIEPVTEGSISKPILIAVSTTSGYFYNMRGVQLTDNTSVYGTFTSSDLSSGVLSITHNLGHQYASVTIIDNNNKVIIPDDITYSSSSSLSVDLSSYGTITGTWRYIILDVGATRTDYPIKIQDADGDTYITTEKTSDLDEINMIIASNERFTLSSSLLSLDLVVLNNNDSFQIKHNGTIKFAIERDDEVSSNVAMNLGGEFLWIDSSNRLHLKGTNPGSDTDGIMLGMAMHRISGTTDTNGQISITYSWTFSTTPVVLVEQPPKNGAVRYHWQVDSNSTTGCTIQAVDDAGSNYSASGLTFRGLVMGEA